MISKIYNCLHEFVLAVDLEYRYNFSDYTIGNKVSDLTQAVKEYINNPETLYKELFETWCKVDIDCFINLMDIILDKPEDWKDLSVKKHPSFGGVFNDLCLLYDEIVARLDLNKNTDDVLPTELNTERARKYFARAIELGYMERTDTGYKWLFGGNRGLARLGYFVEKIYCPNNTEQLPERAINTLFGVNRIASAITQLHNAKKPQKWRTEIDKIFAD